MSRYLFERPEHSRGPEFQKTFDAPLTKYRNRKMQRPSHVGHFHTLTKMEMKDRGMDYQVPDPNEVSGMCCAHPPLFMRASDM